jgi:DNA-binding NtrC family response regulator
MSWGQFRVRGGSVGKPRILLVDDDPLVRRAFARTLGGAYEVIEAEGLSRARAILEPGLVAVVTDLEMETTDAGLALLLEVQRRFSKLGRVLTTGSSSRLSELSDPIRRVCHRVVLKPPGQSELLDSIAAARLAAQLEHDAVSGVSGSDGAEGGKE